MSQPIQTRNGREIFIFQANTDEDVTVSHLRQALKRKNLEEIELFANKKVLEDSDDLNDFKNTVIYVNSLQ